MKSYPTKGRLKELSHKLSESKDSMRPLEQKLLTHLIIAPMLFVLALCLPLLFDDAKKAALILYPIALIGWIAYVWLALKGALGQLNEITAKATGGEMSYLEYRELKGLGLLSTGAFKKSDSADSTRAADVADVDRAVKEPIVKNRIKISLSLKIAKGVILLLAVLLLALPLVRVNLIVSENKISVAKVMLATDNTETFEEAMNTSIAADCLDVPGREYKNLFSVYSTEPKDILDDGEVDGIADTFKVVIFAVEQYFLTVVSLACLIGLIVLVVLYFVKDVYKLVNMDATFSNTTNAKFHQLFDSTAPIGAKEKALTTTALKPMLIKRAAICLLTLLVPAYLPLRYVYALSEMPLVKVSPLLTVGVPLMLLVTVALDVFGAFFGAKNGVVLNRYDSLQKTKTENQ